MAAQTHTGTNGKTNKAIPLILENEGRYEVSDAAVAMLSALPAPIAVVSIAGLWRTGKSYLLNQLSGATCDNAKTGFSVGASVNACTKGLWLWGEPVKLADGLTVLFVDTEGLGSTSRTQTEDSQIFSLALLLSSLFVWNSRGVIDGNALEDFALVVNLTKHIHVRSKAADKALASHNEEDKQFVGGQSGLSAGASAGASAAGHELDELAQHFPGFLWVVRDFTLKLEDNGRRINDRQYLENALKPQRSFTSEAASRNQIRTLLGSFFRERDCVTLVRPAEDESTLKKLSEVPLEMLRPEFQKGLANLKDKVYAQTRAKSVNGRALSGAMLATLAKTYCDSLNAGGVPTISTAWDRVLQSQAAEAVGKCLEDYDRACCATHGLPSVDVLASKALDEDAIDALITASQLPTAEGDIRTEHQNRVANCERRYAKAVWADSSQNPEQDQLNVLDYALDARLARFLEINGRASQQHCENIAETVSKNFETTLNELLPTPDRPAGQAYGEVVRAEVHVDRKAYTRDLDARRTFLEKWRPACDDASTRYFDEARGPRAGDVYCAHVAPRLLATVAAWATTLGVEHRAVQKLARSDAARAEEAAQEARGRLKASKTAAARERDALDRAADAAEIEGTSALQALERLAAGRREEVSRHEASQRRLEEAFQYASSCLDGQCDAVNAIGDGAKEGLNVVREKSKHAIEDSANAASDHDADGTWDAHDLGFERDELAEFAPLRLDALRDRIAEDEKELELMHEHAALTIEHAKVKKMLLADKDHELREYEYQWGVAKANVAASEGELMVVEEEVAVLRGLVLQMHKHLADASRSGRFPADVARGLPRDQSDLLEQLLDGR